MSHPTGATAGFANRGIVLFEGSFTPGSGIGIEDRASGHYATLRIRGAPLYGIKQEQPGVLNSLAGDLEVLNTIYAVSPNVGLSVENRSNANVTTKGAAQQFINVDTAGTRKQVGLIAVKLGDANAVQADLQVSTRGGDALAPNLTFKHNGAISLPLLASDPSDAVDGDMWRTSAGPRARVGSTTYGMTPANDPAWTTWTPTVTAASGTITTVGTVTARYKLVGTICFFNLSVVITTNGTGGGSVNVTLPVASVNQTHASGREDALTGKMLNSYVLAGGSTLSIQSYDNSYPGANGAVLGVTGFYEIAPS